MIDKTCVVFDCYQTLIYKKNLEATIHDFIHDRFHKDVPIDDISGALTNIYDRHKFIHLSFDSVKERKNYYVSYNRELLEILNIESSDLEARRLNHLTDTLTEYSIYDDVLESLVYLNRKKIPTGILANWTKNLEKIIKNTGIFEYFDFVFSSSESKYSKPDPRIFSDLLSNVIKRYNKIYYVGDDYELDIDSAHSAGLIPILIDRKKRYLNKQECITINSLISLKEIV